MVECIGPFLTQPPTNLTLFGGPFPHYETNMTQGLPSFAHKLVVSDP